MKVELQCGDSFIIPEGCKAIVKDGSVIIEKGEKNEAQEFKDGDVLVLVVNGKRCNAFIYKSTDKRGFHYYYVGLDVCNQISISESPSNRWSNNDLSYSTEEEKQLLFDKMGEQGLKWNAEEKRVEKIRWRAKKGDLYYRISLKGYVFHEVDKRRVIDKAFYDALSYFRTEEQAEEAAKRVKETLRKYHEEIGE